MDQSLATLQWTRLQQTKAKLEAHQFEVDLVSDRQACRERIAAMLKEKISVSVGGSMTLAECGIMELLESSTQIRYLDRYHCEDPDLIFHQALSCDLYLTSSNAVTMDGKLVNVDGNGNRVAAMIYGPKKVVVIAGVNKLVRDEQQALQRIQTLAAPANCVRLNKENPCTRIGYCVDCQQPGRICSAAVTLHRSHVPGRIHVILVNEALGY